VKVHKKNGGQLNSSLCERAIVDWSLPHPIQCPETVQATSKLYIKRDAKHGLKEHRDVHFFDQRQRAAKNTKQARLLIGCRKNPRNFRTFLSLRF